MAARARLSPARRQLRDFALIWTGITLLMGGCTFFAIYLAYGGLTGNGSALDRGVAIPAATTTTPQNVAAAATLPPTRQLATVTPTLTPTVTNTSAPNVTPTHTQPPSNTPTPRPVDDNVFQVGIQAQYALDLNPEGQRGIIRDVLGLGMNWMKQQVRWELYEPQRDTYDWTVLDMVMPIAAEFGVKVMASVVTAPDWAREPGTDLSRHGPPANYQDYVDFVVAMLQRYPGMIHAVEVWNEQNLDREWWSARGLNPSDYVRLLQMTHDAIKAIDPGIIVISGALSPTGGLTLNGVVAATDDFVYLDDMIRAGLLNYMDCLGVHHNGYNIGPDVTWDAVPNDPGATFRGPFNNPHHSWSFRSTLETYANKVQVAGGAQKLCITEFGWAVAQGIDGFNVPGLEFALDNTPDEQAQFFVAALNRMRDSGFVRLAFIWNMNYGPNAGWAPDNDNVPYSLIGPGWAHRPAWDAIAQWNRDYNGSTGG